MTLADLLQLRPWPKEDLLAGPSLDFYWEYIVKVPPEALWPHISDTESFNREFGFEKRQQQEKNGHAYVQETLLGNLQEWIEDPWEWVAERECVIHRRYLRGAAFFFRSIYQIEPHPQGSLARIHLGWIPRTQMWRMLLSLGIPKYKNKFAQAFAKIEKFYHAKNKVTAISSPLVRIEPKTLPPR